MAADRFPDMLRRSGGAVSPRGFGRVGQASVPRALPWRPVPTDGSFALASVAICACVRVLRLCRACLWRWFGVRVDRRSGVRPSEGETLGLSEADLDRAEGALGHVFRDRSLLVRALTHASIADRRLESNERLEFLGDAVLGMLVCEELYRSFPDLLEGEMTKIKSVAVSRRTCSKIAVELGLEEILLIGKGMRSRHALPSSLSAAALESVIGAIYLDGGYGAARSFLMPHLSPRIREAAASGHQQNFKSVLQAYAQQQVGDSAEYVLLDEKGPDHAKCFEVCVELDGERFPSCWAPSKKQAEQQAALLALERLGLIVRGAGGQPVYSSEGRGEPVEGAEGESGLVAAEAEPEGEPAG